MIFWLGILISLVLAALAAKKGLYESWVILFNIVISMYLGIALLSVLKSLLSLGNGSTVDVLVMLGTAIVSFSLLYGLAYVAFLSQFEVAFPKILDAAGGGFLGFLAGLLAWSFLVFAVCTSPIGQNKVVKNLGIAHKTDLGQENKNISYLRWWTGTLDKIIGTEEGDNTNTIITAILKNSTASKKPKPVEAKGPQVPDTGVDKPEKIKPSDLGPPPDLTFEEI